MKTLAVAAQKGGVGKTTVAVNLAAALAEQGKRVLVIDVDPQGSAGAALGVTPGALTAYDVLMAGCPLADAIVATEEGFDIVPASAELSQAAIALPNRTASPWQWILASALEAVADRYDVVILDTPPTLGPLTVTALVAADELLIPTQLEVASFQQLFAVARMVETIRSGGKRALNAALVIAGVVPTFVETRTRLSRGLLETLRTTSPAPVLAGIPLTVTLREATAARQSVIAYAPTHVAAAAFRTLAEEVSDGSRS